MKDLIQNIKVIILSTIVILSVSFVYAAWTDPTANPTGGNTDAPINVGTADQIKNGGLIVNAFSALQNAYFAGNVGIGTASPGNILDVKASANGQGITITGSAGDISMKLQDGGTGDPGYLDLYRSGVAQVRLSPDISYFNTGNVGIGTVSPEAKLHVVGNIKIIDGNQGANKVLTSDSSGLASWQTAVSGGGVTTVYDYGTSQSGGTIRPVIVAYGGGIWLGGNQGASISGLPFSSAGSFTCIVTPTTWNGGGGGPYGGGPDQGTGLIGCYKYNGSSVWLGNTDDQGRTVNWFAIGY